MGSNTDGLLNNAREDVAIIMNLLPSIDPPGPVSFHAQQAAEKMVKHVFEINRAEYQKIHDIDILLEEAVSNDWLQSISQDELENANSLSMYVIFGRYADEPITRESALKAIEWCNQVADILERNGYPAVKINV